MRQIFLLCFFVATALTAQAQDTTLFRAVPESGKTVDEQINEKVAPFTGLVERIIFFDFAIKKELVFNEVIVEATPTRLGNSKFTKDAPYEVEYESENIPLNKFFIIDYVDEETYQLRYRFLNERGDDFMVSNTHSFGEPVTIDGFTFNIEKTLPGEVGRYKFKVTEITVPFVLIWLILGALIFTIYFRFINVRRFGMAINVVRGKYTDPNEKGEVSHFQALTAALSATVGLGNIAGVAIAMSLGGPGATFWMIIAGLLGMSSKFVECTLGVRYREIDEKGVVHGGPMYYLKKGLAGRGMAGFGKVLAAFFAIMCIGGSFGGGNMFQVNQAFNQFKGVFSGVGIAQEGYVFGIVMALLVAVVIIGGIKSIARVTEKIVPLMIAVYVAAALFILGKHVVEIPEAFALIMRSAFSSEAVAGGMVGVLIQGIRRAAFSNEAGIGSASIAHSAVKTEHPASEGLVALLEPFIDTVIVCTMTALVIVITGNYINTDIEDGITITSNAFADVIGWFPLVLAVAVILFAFSTMISWSYYGLQSWTFLFGNSKISDISYKVIFCIFVVVGASMNLASVIGFSDAMIFAMCFPNVLGMYFLMPEVREEVNRYVRKIKSNEKGG